MEFAIFLNGFIPGPAAHDTDMQHLSYQREAEYAIFADKHNWKYCWLGEHHGLVEYSQLSAPEVAIGYLAAQTDYIHLGILEGPTTVEWQGAAIDNDTENGDYYRIRYTHPNRTLAVYKGTSLDPAGTFEDIGEAVPHGEGYRYVGMNFEASLLTQGIQVTSWNAMDAV